MNIRAYFLLLIASSMYYIAFAAPFYFWWLAFFWMIPLFYALLIYKISWMKWLWWAFFTFGLHLSGVFLGIAQLSGGKGWYAWPVYLFLLSYCGFISALLLGTLTQLNRKFFKNNIAAQTAALSLILFSFFYLLEHFYMLPFDRCEGYFFMHPLLPLAHQPIFLYWLPIVGKNILTFLLILFNGGVALVFLHRYLLAIITPLSIFLFWTLPLLQQHQIIITPAWHSQVATLPMVFKQHIALHILAQNAQQHFKQLLEKYPQTEVIIMPEAAFYCNHLDQQCITQLWGKAHIKKAVHIITGAFRWNQQKYHNTLYWLHNGNVQQLFDKRHAMPLTERLPSWFATTRIKNLYFEKFPEISASDNHHPLWKILSGLTVIPYICSELFFTQQPDDQYPDFPILSCCNDRWTTSEYMHYLMFLVARFKAIEWQREIIYVSFYYQYYIDKVGNVLKLQ